MKCPQCGSDRVTSQAITETHSQEITKGFGWIKACIGFLLFNVWGILCGLCGMGKRKQTTTTRSKVIHICQNCGYSWYD